MVVSRNFQLLSCLCQGPLPWIRLCLRNCAVDEREAAGGGFAFWSLVEGLSAFAFIISYFLLACGQQSQVNDLPLPTFGYCKGWVLYLFFRRGFLPKSLWGTCKWRWRTVPLQQCSWCSRPWMNVEGVEVLHCVDYNSECLPFFLRQNIFQSQICFHKGAETLRVACQINLGKPSGRKTPTGPVEYLGHASAESQAEEEMFEGNFFLTVALILVFQRCTTMQPGRQWIFPMSFDFFADSNANCSRSFLHCSCTRLLVRTLRQVFGV